MKNYNIFVDFLNRLGVRHTSYANKLYDNHPYKNTLYGISNLLWKYNIDNEGIRIDKEDLSEINTPFIAHVSNDFIIVDDVLQTDVKCIWGGKKYILSIDNFSNIWSGVVLIANVSNNSIEPNYKYNFYNELFAKSKKTFLLVSLFSLFILTLQISVIIENIYFIFLNILGIYIAYLLFLKQNKIHSSLADRVCSLFNQNTCNTVLDTDGAKILSFTWSEIGLAYFCSNLLISLYFPDLFIYAVWANIVVLPYSFWSVWYQYKIVHQWCVLCLLVQALLWIIFIVNILTISVFVPEFINICTLKVILIYTVFVLIINKLSNILQKKSQLDIIQYKYNEIKQRDDVFEMLLLKQEYYFIDKSISSIIFGNSEAKNMISVLTNPHCSPCANLHSRINSIMKEFKDKVCIQYIYSSFNDELLISNRFLIAIFFQRDRLEAESIYNEWFRSGRFNPNSFMKKYKVNLNTNEVNLELEKHNLWKLRNNLNKTPLILLNGYLLPENYEIEDIINICIN